MRTITVPGIENVGIPIATKENTEFLASVLKQPKRFAFRSRTDIAFPSDMYADWTPTKRRGMRPTFYPPTANLLVQSAHAAFQAHVPLTLRPEVLWHMIAHEVAVHVKANAGRYAKKFGQTEGEKKHIAVRDDELARDQRWDRTIPMFRAKLTSALPEGLLDRFLPQFSTSTPESDTAALVTFMDTVSEYFAYEVYTLCGIPEVRLHGTPEDWERLQSAVAALADDFPALRPWWVDLTPVVAELASAARGAKVDAQFWRSLYNENSGSGKRTMNGWITAFTAHVCGKGGVLVPRQRFGWAECALELSDFPSVCATVPFTWNNNGDERTMGFAAGILGVDDDEGSLAPRIGFAVYEPNAR